MIGCMRTRVRKQPIIALYFEPETVLKFYNTEAWDEYQNLVLAKVMHCMNEYYLLVKLSLQTNTRVQVILAVALPAVQWFKWFAAHFVCGHFVFGPGLL